MIKQHELIKPGSLRGFQEARKAPADAWAMGGGKKREQRLDARL
jgi:hypothetical protein